VGVFGEGTAAGAFGSQSAGAPAAIISSLVGALTPSMVRFDCAGTTFTGGCCC
jgi:hypothetical protein